MTSKRDLYSELLSLTQSHLLVEYESGACVFSDPQTKAFFQEWIPKNKTAPSAPRLPPTTKKTPIQQAPPVPAPKYTAATVGAQTEKKPTPHAPESSPKPTKTKTFFLEPMAKAVDPDFTSLKKLLASKAPQIECLPPPNDTEAKRIGTQWKETVQKPELVILSFEENESTKRFLYNLAKAIKLEIAPAAIYSVKVIDKQHAWERLFKLPELRLILSTDYGIYASEKLKKFYSETEKGAQRYLGGIPLFLLTDIAFYLEQPSLKPALWQALKAMFNKTKTS